METNFIIGGKTELKMLLYVLLLLYVVQKHTVYLCAFAFASVDVQVFCFGRQNRLGCHWRDEGRWIVYYYCCYCYCARVAISDKLTLAATTTTLTQLSNRNSFCNQKTKLKTNSHNQLLNWIHFCASILPATYIICMGKRFSFVFRFLSKNCQICVFQWCNKVGHHH